MGEFGNYETFRPAGESESLKLSKDDIEANAGRVNGRVLDIACGSGKLLELLQGLATEFYGIDVLLDHTDLTRSFGIVADATLLPFKNETFEFITSLGLMELLDKRRAIGVIHEISKITSKNGVLVLVTLNYYSLFIRVANRNHPSQLTFLSKSAWEKLLEDNGFTVESIRNAGKFGGVKLPKIIRKLIDTLLPSNLSDRVIIIAKKRAFETEF